jgi:cation diffusion facilitator family transporter
MLEVTDTKAVREKRMAALSSVFAAIFLTGTKLTIGLLTGSLGILSEAAHSGLDLVAAGVTFFAVRASDRPADMDHPYGHGKVENFSALVETLLLFITCAWIVYEAIHRLTAGTQVEVSYWSFIVMSLSIVIDAGRSRVLMRTAKKHRSQALEADALHFSTDILSSAVVIAGLIAVFFAQQVKTSNPGLAGWLFRADAFAALGVSVIVIYVSWNMGKRAVGALMDSTPTGLDGRIKQAVAALPGVLAVDRVRSRESGSTSFVDLTLAVARTASLEEAHVVASRAEDRVRELVPHADVMVHVDPVAHNEKSLLEGIYSVAGRQGISIHDLHIHDVRGALSAEFHAEVPEDLSVSLAHERVTALEQAVRVEIPTIRAVTAHIEPVGDRELLSEARNVTSRSIQDTVTHLAQDIPGVTDCHDVSILQGKDVSVSFHCTVAPDMPIGQAHALTERIESELRRRLPSLGRIIVHVEPPGAS